MSYTLSEISSFLGLEAPEKDFEIDVLLTDSRSLSAPADSLFFAISTPNNDGHRYIRQLYEAGVKAFCVSYIPENMLGVSDVCFLKVDDVTKALQTIARAHRESVKAKVIGITGSRGKTTVKEWLYQLLEPDCNVVRSPRSFNSRIGVPLSLWEITPDTETAIIEAGVSRSGEMNTLQNMIKPSIGIITNISSEHDEGFSSREAKVNEKIKLFRDSDCVIYCADDTLIASAVENSCNRSSLLGWSRINAGAPLYINRTATTEKETEIEYSYLGAKGRLTISLTSDSEIENALHCLAALLLLGMDTGTIAERMAKLKPVTTRLEVIEGVNNCLVIYDNYTSDLHSLAPALDFMNRRPRGNRTTTLILSDVMHEALPPSKRYKAVADLARRRGIDRVIGIGEEISANSRYFNSQAIFFPDTAAMLDAMGPDDFHDEMILIKGAPGFSFERVSDMLEARQHETVMEVNLDAMVHNFNLFRAMLKPTTGIVCMVKASGYGAGSYELARSLQSQGAAYLAVAVLDEGVELRRAGITMPIMVLNPRVVNYRTLFAYNLEPEIYSFDILHEIISAAENCGLTDYPVHIKLDTGMHRLGFLEKDIPEITDILRRQKAVRPVSVFSHLAAADDPMMDDYTLSQFEYFDRCADLLQRGFNHYIMRHILNSTGISRFPEHQYDLVRLGICLYGIATMHDGSQDELRPVSSLYTTVISIKEWPAGTTVGYNRRGVLHRDSVVATIPVGYADGLNRHLGNGHHSVMINGTLCPIVGNICMDACMVDVTDCSECHVGDRVEIFGPEIPVDTIAETLDTIPYEILTSVSSRVKRVYYRE